LPESFPGSGDAYIPIDPENWDIITEGMAEVTQPAYFHTAGSAHLEGIDFGGKTGTAQVMSHEALDKTSKGRNTDPNVWFVGVTPSHNPELVVAVLWQNGNKSYYPARIGAKVVSAYVEKQRRLANNLQAPKTAPVPTEMTAIWTVPGQPSGAGTNSANHDVASDRVQSGRFLIDHGHVVSQAAPKSVQPESGQKAGAPALGRSPTARAGEPAASPPKPPALHQPPSGSNPQPAIANSGKG